MESAIILVMELIKQNFFLELRETQDMGRGLFATVDIPQGTSLFDLSNESFITYETMCQHCLFKQISGETHSKIAQFAYFLAYMELAPADCPQSQRLQVYLSQLLTSFDNLVCWDEKQLEWLDDQPLKVKIRSKRDSMYQAYLKIRSLPLFNLQRQVKTQESHTRTNKRGNHHRQKLMDNSRPDIVEDATHYLQRVTFERLLRFVSVIESRNVWYENIDDVASEVGALVPALEMLNHRNDAQCRVEINSLGIMVIAKTDIKKGEQVYVNYGNNYGPAHLLEFYGMLPNYIQVYEKENLSPKVKELAEKSKRRKLAIAYNSISKRACSPLHSPKKDPLQPKF